MKGLLEKVAFELSLERVQVSQEAEVKREGTPRKKMESWEIGVPCIQHSK